VNDVANLNKIPEDLLILVNEQDEEIGTLPKVDCHIGNGTLHRAFSLFLFNADGNLLLQKRNPDKMLWGGYWSNSCCSHPRQGETVPEAAARRLQEELGVSCELNYLYKFAYQAQFGEVGSENELCWVLAGVYSGEISANPDEIADWRLISPAELSHEIATDGDNYTPWLKLEWEQITAHYLDDVLGQ